MRFDPRTHLALPALALAAGLLAACSESPVMPEDLSPQFAKPAPDVFPSRFTIPASGPGVFGDGLGDYVDGVCGVGARIGTNPSTGNLVAILNLPQSPAGGCSLRTVTLRLGLQHLGVNPDGSHNDVAATPPGGPDFAVSSVKIGEEGAGTVNSNVCLHLSRKGTYTGAGMRFWSAGYPGSNDLVVTIGPAGYWHVTSQPYPDNVAYCDGDAGLTYWHVDVDLNVAPK